MTKVTYTHIENIPASDTVSDVCALWRVYGREDNGGFRVGLEYGSRLEYFGVEEATRRARRAIDVRRLDLEFCSVSIQTLQEESKVHWATLTRSDAPTQEQRLLNAIERCFEGEFKLFGTSFGEPSVAPVVVEPVVCETTAKPDTAPGRIDPTWPQFKFNPILRKLLRM